MTKLLIKGGLKVEATLVSNTFIDTYLAEANGEFVKVYLCLLRLLSESGVVPEVSELADRLQTTEKDVQRALTYWQSKGVFTIENEEAAAVSEPAPVEAALPAHNTSLGDLGEDMEFAQLLYIAERYKGAPLSRPECDIFAYLYGDLKLSAELLEYLVEQSVSNGHKSVRYMEAIALDWHRQGIATVEQAKQNGLYRKEEYAVLKALGISGNPVPKQQEYIKQWMSEWGFSLDIVEEACSRTIMQIAKPNFGYVHGILKDWHTAGVHSKADITALDAKHRLSGAQKTKEGAKPRTNTRFHNFEERGTDYDSLVRQLNANS